MTSRRATTIPEALAITLATAALLCLLLAHAPRTRHLAAQAESLANLKQFGSTTGDYAADYQDQF